MKTRSVLNDSALACAVMGLLVALFLTIEHNSADLGGACTTGGCSGALHSVYGHVGPIPTAAFGVGMYLTLVVLLLLRGRKLNRVWDELEKEEGDSALVSPLSRSVGEGGRGGEGFFSPAARERGSGGEGFSGQTEDAVRRFGLAVWGIAGVGFLISWLLQYAAVFVLQHFCQYCFVSACLVSLVFLISTWDCWFVGKPLSKSFKLGMAGLVAFVALLAMQVAAKGRNTLADNGPTTKMVDPGIKDIVVVPNMRIEGNPNAPYLVVEFMDYGCPHCRRAWRELGPLLKTYKTRFRLAIRNFPMASQWSKDAAEVALAAGAQGKFWQMRAYLFDHQDELRAPTFQPKQFLDYGRACGLDMARFQKDLDNHTFQDAVQADSDDAKRAGSTQVPSLYLVTPTTVWRLQGDDGLSELRSALKKPNDALWR